MFDPTARIQDNKLYLSPAQAERLSVLLLNAERLTGDELVESAQEILGIPIPLKTELELVVIYNPADAIQAVIGRLLELQEEAYVAGDSEELARLTDRIAELQSELESHKFDTKGPSSP